MPRTPEFMWPALFNPYGAGRIHVNTFGGTDLLHRRITLTNAEIIALHNNQVTLVPAPQSDELLVFFRAVIQTNFTAGVYGNVNPDGYMRVDYHSTGSYVPCGSYAPNSSSLGAHYFDRLMTRTQQCAQLIPLTAYQDGARLDDWSVIAGGLNSSSVPLPKGYEIVFALDNAGAGAFTGGNPANKMYIDVWYDVTNAIP